MRADPLGRFVNRVEFGDCWLWTGALDRKGYGRFAAGGRHYQSHRWAYEYWVGELPPWPMVLDHLCRTKSCVRPEHLESVTVAENNRRAVSGLGRSCPKGHPYDEANAYWYAADSKQCRACNYEAVQRYRERNLLTIGRRRP